MTPLRFSVVIPCYNQGAFLDECLESVRRQTLPAHEIIVVDDGSTDPWTVDRIDALCQPPVRLVRQANRGLAGARNSGIRAATGDWIVPLDSDDQLRPEALAAYADAIAREPSVDVWYPDIEHFGLEEDVWVAPEFNGWRQLWSNQMVCSSAIRRAVFDAGVFYNERMRAGYEDWEFYIHACSEAGFRARTLREPVFRYRRWGYSMLSAANAQLAALRAQLQQERPIYRDDARLLELKRRESPFFAVSASTPALAPALATQHFADWRVVDESGRPTRDGDLAVFREHHAHGFLVSLADEPLARALEADPFLLEKVARTVFHLNPAVTWLVGARDPGAAYPGFTAHGVDPGALCYGFVVSARHIFGAPEIPKRSESLVADLASHLRSVAPGSAVQVIVGAAGPLDRGVPLPEEAKVEVAEGPLPNWEIALRERVQFLGESASRFTKALIGRRRHERLQRTRAFVALRSRVRREPLPERGSGAVPEAPVAPVLGITRAGPFEVERMASRGYRDTGWFVADEAPRLPPPLDADAPGLLIAVPWIVHGGADRATIDLLQGISRVAPHVRRYVVSTQPARMAWADELLPHVHGAFSLAEPPRDGTDVVALVERLRADAMLIVSSQTAFDALPAVRLMKRRIRVAAQFHGFDRDAKTGALTGHPVYAASRYNNLIDAYAVISQFVADRLTDHLYVSPTKINVVHLGIDRARFAAARRERFDADGPLRVLWLGRLSPEKDPAVFVRVARAWKERHGASAARFTLVGSGPLEAEVRDLARASDVGDVLEIAGPAADPVPRYRDADCVVLTSRYEGIPVVVYEAMAAGLPVITPTRNTSIPEVLSDDDALFVRDQSDPAEYVRALERALEDRDAMRRRADSLAERAAQFDQPRYAEDMLKILFPDLLPTGIRNVC